MDKKEIMVYFISGHKAIFPLEEVRFYRENDDLPYWIREGFVVININAVSFIKRVESKDGGEDLD